VGASFCEQKEAKKLQFSGGCGNALEESPDKQEFFSFFQKRTACSRTDSV
jgi:hypothetical protein